MSLDEKPPLGLKPTKIWKEERLEETLRAVLRQIQSSNPDAKLIHAWLNEARALANEVYIPQTSTGIRDLSWSPCG